MAAEPRPTPTPAPLLTVTETGDERLVLTFAGDVDCDELRTLEEHLADPRLNEVPTWVWDMENVTHLDLACAYALLRAVALRSPPPAVTVRGARRPVRRTLHHTGVDAVAAIEE